MKKGRGTSYEVTLTLGVGLLKWYDNKVITMASNFITSGIPESVSPWDKKKTNNILTSKDQKLSNYINLC